LVFPNGHLFEDILFHSGVVASLRSFAVSSIPSFTYYRRYGRAQITAGAGDNRLDAVAVAKISLETFAQSGRFSNVTMRGALMVSAFRLLRWCEDCISHVYRYQFHEALIYLVETLDPGYLRALKPYASAGMPYAEVVPYIIGLRREAASRNPAGVHPVTLEGVL
jgi:hypothetical protein